MEDFVFGTLATDELRAQFVRSQRAGVTHAHARQPIDPSPGQPITFELTVGPAYPLDRARIEWMVNENPGFDEKPGFWTSTAMQLVDVEWDMLVWGYVRRFRVSLPGQSAGSILRYRMVAYNSHGDEVPADNGVEYACFIAEDPPPDWSRTAVIYQIFVERFNPGDGKDWHHPPHPSGFFGGTLRGITEKLDYLHDLGVNVLWLTPIFPSPSHHGYDATDLFDIEPRLGTKADLRQLLDQAHQREMRVLMDFVPNHWSWRHQTFQDAIRNPSSHYQDWYIFSDWPDKYQTFFGVRELPQINLENLAAREHVLEAAKYWLDFGVDGYRVDYALGPSPVFWAYFRQATRSTNPESWTFGEVVEPSQSQRNFEGGLDGCLDFILLEALRQAFAFGRWDARQLADFLTRHEAYFPATFSRPSFLDNHDMNRFLWAAGNDKRRLRLAALCQFTLSGPPILYYGNEVGLSQERDVRQGELGIPEESRLPMIWGAEQDVELLAYFRQLIALRRAHPEFSQPGLRITWALGNQLCYQRDGWLVCLNLGEQVEVMELQAAASEPELLFTANGPIKRLAEAAGGMILELPPLGGAVLRL